MQSKLGEGKALYIFRDDDKKKDGKSQILQHVPAPNDNEAFDEGLKHMKAVAELICSGEIEDSAKARRAARDALVAPNFVKRAAKEQAQTQPKKQSRKQPTSLGVARVYLYLSDLVDHRHRVVALLRRLRFVVDGALRLVHEPDGFVHVPLCQVQAGRVSA